MKIDVKHVAKLAELEVKDKESEKLEQQLSTILDYIKKLEEVDTKNIEPTSQVTNLENVTRSDEIKPSLSQEKALSNTKSKYNGMFKVPAILEE